MEDFEKSIKFLLRKKFVFIPLTHANYFLSNSIKRKHRYVVCTFDDGYSNISDTIPLLEKYHIPATFFINTAYLDGNAVKWTDIANFIDSADNPSSIPENIKESIQKLKKPDETIDYEALRRNVEKSYSAFKTERSLYIAFKELFAIKNPLFTIGLHGHEHIHHSLMTPDWCKQNIIENLKILKEHPNFIPFLSFPFGSYTDIEAEYFEKMGFRTLRCNGLLNYINNIPLNRSEIDGKVISFRLMIKLAGESFSFKKLIKTNVKKL
jgi:peptidoglycan/xylan/chitin deacetylase (PgdA/CDA1 family)